MFGLVGLIGLIWGTREFIEHYLSERTLERLYLRASGAPSFFQNTEDSILAVDAIAQIGGDDAKRALFKIAERESFVPGLSVQLSAIKSLNRYGGADTSAFLASLVRTDSALDVRLAAAETISSVGCNKRCAELSLAYLKQVSLGTLNREDDLHGLSDPELVASVRAYSAQKQRLTYDLLRKDIIQDSDNANRLLADEYRLGATDPDEFAIRFVLEAGDRDACPMLNRSLRMISAGSNDRTRLRDELTQTIAELHCPDMDIR